MLTKIHFQQISSTNTWAKEHVHDLTPDQILCITAEEQTAGRGRFLRPWLSPKGLNIYVTFCFPLPKDFPFLPNLSELGAISCVKTLEDLGFSPQIKWPNDILLQEQKVSGILCEVSHTSDHLIAIVGIGINVNMPAELLSNLRATSLMILSHKTWDLPPLLDQLTAHFLKDLELFKSKGFAPFHAFYSSRLAFIGKSFTWKTTQIHTAICQGITSSGKLQALLPSGQILEISSGEVLFSSDD